MRLKISSQQSDYRYDGSIIAAYIDFGPEYEPWPLTTCQRLPVSGYSHHPHSIAPFDWNGRPYIRLHPTPNWEFHGLELVIHE